MPIPFRDLDIEGQSDVAAYLRFVDEPGGGGLRGAIFTMSTRGEPLDFSFTRIDVSEGVLWRVEETRSQAILSLTKALFQTAVQVPQVLLVLAQETPSTVFAEHLEVEVPVCRVAIDHPSPSVPPESAEPVSDSLTLLWANGIPGPETPGRRTVDLLKRRQLLVEPFERVAKGISEGFGD